MGEIILQFNKNTQFGGYICTGVNGSGKVVDMPFPHNTPFVQTSLHNETLAEFEARMRDELQICYDIVERYNNTLHRA